MRRALVLSDESARHPLRASLPPHIRKSAAGRRHWPSLGFHRNWRLSRSDWRYFAAIYCVGLVAVTAFIA